MKIEHWLIVATIISAIVMAVATLFAPALAVLAQARMSQPKPKPVDNQPKNLTQRIGGWFNRHPKLLLSLQCLTILLAVGILVFESSRSSPIDRASVFIIVLSVTVIIIQGISIFMVGLLRWLIKHAQGQSDINRGIVEILRDMNKIITDLDKAVSLTAPKESPHGLIDKLQTKLKKLLGD